MIKVNVLIDQLAKPLKNLFIVIICYLPRLWTIDGLCIYTFVLKVVCCSKWRYLAVALLRTLWFNCILLFASLFLSFFQPKLTFAFQRHLLVCINMFYSNILLFEWFYQLMISFLTRMFIIFDWIIYSFLTRMFIIFDRIIYSFLTRMFIIFDWIIY